MQVHVSSSSKLHYLSHENSNRNLLSTGLSQLFSSQIDSLIEKKDLR